MEVTGDTYSYLLVADAGGRILTYRLDSEAVAAARLSSPSHSPTPSPSPSPVHGSSSWSWISGGIQNGIFSLVSPQDFKLCMPGTCCSVPSDSGFASNQYGAVDLQWNCPNNGYPQ